MALKISGSTVVDDSSNATFADISGTSVSGGWVASQAEAEAGAASTKVMTPLRVIQAIDANPITTYGALGTYVFGYALTTGLEAGASIAGSSIEPAGYYINAATAMADDTTAGVSGTTKGGAALSGTWQVMGQVNNTSGSSLRRFTLFLRIA